MFVNGRTVVEHSTRNPKIKGLNAGRWNQEIENGRKKYKIFTFIQYHLTQAFPV
jgi:hypothetical protein